MDIFSHAIAGAATGLAFGYPVAGAVAGALPDAVLGLRRRAAPTVAYNLTHSVWGLSWLTAATSLLGDGRLTAAIGCAFISHLVLDMPTHGPQWAPPLLYPWLPNRISSGSEWEFFNASWFRGLRLTILWSVMWLLVSR